MEERDMDYISGLLLEATNEQLGEILSLGLNILKHKIKIQAEVDL